MLVITLYLGIGRCFQDTVGVIQVSQPCHSPSLSLFQMFLLLAKSAFKIWENLKADLT